MELPNKITVFVGPNNSGKSQTLKDIRCIMDRQQSPFKSPVILKDDNNCFDIPNLDEIRDNVAFKKSLINVNNYTIEAIGSNLFGKASIEYYMPQLDSFDSLNEQNRRNLFFQWFGKYYIALMDAETRLRLSSETDSFSPSEATPDNILQSLFLKPSLEEVLKQAFKESFNQDITLDCSQLVKLSLRVGVGANQIPKNVRFAHSIAKDIPKIDSQGDGYRSFAGIIIGLLICTNRIILLDEPEAFLHPAQAFFLGKWIGTNKEVLGSQLLICTHSSNFLSGILTGTQELDVIRLHREGNHTFFNKIPPIIAKQLIGNPILSSQRVIEGIFHKGVVICEADADRAVYQSVASVCHNSNREILFIHAHNKQTLALVADVLKKTGTPVAVIADIDILRPDNDLDDVYQVLADSPMDEILKERQMQLDTFIENRPESEVLKELSNSVEELVTQLHNGEHTLEGARSALSRIKRETSKWSEIKRQGISALGDEQKENARVLIDKLCKVGLFVVPVGELEGWISFENRRKNKWIIPALELIYNNKTPECLISFVANVLAFF